MLILRMFQTVVPAEKTELFEALPDRVPHPFRPMIQPIRILQSELLGIPAKLDGLTSRRRLGRQDPRYFEPFETESGLQSAEVFTDGRALYAVALHESDTRRPGSRRRENAENNDVGSRLYLYYIGPDPQPSNLDGIKFFLNEFFGSVLVSRYYRSRRFDDLRGEARQAPATPSPQDIAAAAVLQDAAVRKLAIAVKASGGLLVRDLPKQVPEEKRSGIEVMQRDLIEAGLIESEIVVVCKKTQAQTARIANREALEEIARTGLKCACGQPMAQERIEEALTVTALGRAQLEKSRWLNTIVLRELEAVGVSPDRTLIEQQDSGDELDLLVEISGELVFFELKDKEFNLGSAYSFGAKIGIVQPDHSVIITTGYVGNDAKDHFQRARSATRMARGTATHWELAGPRRGVGAGDIQYIEGLDNLSFGIRQLAGRIYAADATRILDEVLPFALMDPVSIVQALGESMPRTGTTKDKDVEGLEQDDIPLGRR
jgi:hypothetical protein